MNNLSFSANSDEESEEEKTEGWGKKKAYWSGDTADLEIGQDVQDAEDEEEAAEVQMRTLPQSPSEKCEETR